LVAAEGGGEEGGDKALAIRAASVSPGEIVERAASEAAAPAVVHPLDVVTPAHEEHSVVSQV